MAWLKKSASIIGLSALICLIIFCITAVGIYAVLIVKAYFNDGHIPSVFGVKPLICASDSMAPEIQAGSLVIIEQTVLDDLAVGDIICYMSNKTAVIERISYITEDNGAVYYITKADADSEASLSRVSQKSVEGIYNGVSIMWLGQVMSFMQTTTGMLVFVAVPLVLIAAATAAANSRSRSSAYVEEERMKAELMALRTGQDENKK